MFTAFSNLSPARRLGLAVSLALTLVMLIVAAYWVLRVNYAKLFDEVDDRTAAQIIARLEEQKIPFAITQTPTGSQISVPAEVAEQMRVTLNHQLGLPEVQGLELFENTDYGMSDFSQDVAYKRALQGELARTLTQMPGVAGARVHLTFAPDRLFKADRQSAKAAVYLELIPDVRFSAHQVTGVKKLVANAVENLNPEQVAVMDLHGVELQPANSESLNSDVEQQFSIKRSIEQELLGKAYGVLTLLVPTENIGMSIDVQMNFDQRKKRVQGFANGVGNQGALMKQREVSVTRENDSGGSTIGAEPVTTQEVEAEYMHGQETEETVFSTGAIERINVGIVLRAQLQEADVAKLQDALKAGLGIDTFRGDQLALRVVNAPKPLPIAVAALPSVPKSALPHEQSPAAELADAAEPQPTHLTTPSAITAHWKTGVALLVLLGSAVTAFAVYQYRRRVRRREALLLEVTEWLRQESHSYG